MAGTGLALTRSLMLLTNRPVVPTVASLTALPAFPARLPGESRCCNSEIVSFMAARVCSILRSWTTTSWAFSSEICMSASLRPAAECRAGLVDVLVTAQACDSAPRREVGAFDGLQAGLDQEISDRQHDQADQQRRRPPGQQRVQPDDRRRDDRQQTGIGECA